MNITLATGVGMEPVTLSQFVGGIMFNEGSPLAARGR